MKKNNSVAMYDADHVISMKDIVIDYQMKKQSIRAIAGVNLKIMRGKITALVGESGSGKTTLSAAILNCISEPGKLTSGRVIFSGKSKEDCVSVHELSRKKSEEFRWSKVSMVFQGAQSALNPVMTIEDHFIETMRVHHWKGKQTYTKRCYEVLEIVNLSSSVLKMYPHELSGGMKQRVMIAFSLLLEPDLIILDEPTTALDVITQHYIFTLLRDINEKLGISMLLLTHDIAIVASFADYVGVLYAGQLMEFGKTEEVFSGNGHPYTQGLIDATPALYKPVESMRPINGQPPDLRKPPSGCRFHPRCPKAMDQCRDLVPDDNEQESNRVIKCHLFN